MSIPPRYACLPHMGQTVASLLLSSKAEETVVSVTKDRSEECDFRIWDRNGLLCGKRSAVRVYRDYA